MEALLSAWERNPVHVVVRALHMPLPLIVVGFNSPETIHKQGSVLNQQGHLKISQVDT